MYAFTMLRRNFDLRYLSMQLVCLVALLLTIPICPAQNSGEGQSAPGILIEPESFDFGTVDRGVWLKHKFKVTNTGRSNLVLHRAYATCGCTVPKLAKSQLAPEESTDLDVSVDTSMKQNRITKSVLVTSNDPNKPLIKIDLNMNVVDPHQAMSDEGKVKIFTDAQCASCHVTRGKGLLGRDLYNADCAMCHGPKAEGAIGPTLIGPYEETGFAQRITQVASFGSKQHHSMPGFLASAGGPLSKQELDSIVKYLADLSSKRRKIGH